jgi:S-adenosylmethionine uptake transporter
MTRAYARGRTLLSATLAYSAVVFASVFGWLLWADLLDALSWLAIALIAASGLIASLRSSAGAARSD